VRDLRLKDIVFSSTAREARPTVILDDVIGARVSGLASTPVSGNASVVQLTHTSDVWISDSAAPSGTGIFLGVNGADSSNILLSANDLRGARKVFDAAGDVSPKTVTLNGNISTETT
jgi:hypothetical protein